MGTTVTLDEMHSRLVRYGELRPCTTAFIDTRTPGSEKKENFTIIGPGVAENPDQHVHISIPREGSASRWVFQGAGLVSAGTGRAERRSELQIPRLGAMGFILKPEPCGTAEDMIQKYTQSIQL